MKELDNLTRTGQIICVIGLFLFIVGFIIIASLIPVALSHFTIVSGISTLDLNEVYEGLLNATVIGGIAYCGLGLGFIAIGALFQNP